METFVLHALLGGAGVALAAGPLGCFVVWRRMAYFGDSLAHTALPGAALGIILGVDVRVGALAACAAFALLLALLQARGGLATDTLLGVLSHAALAGGLVVIGLIDAPGADPMAYLFGDILAVSAADLAWIWGGGAAALAALAVLWRPLLAITVHREMAEAEGVRADRVRLAFALLIAVVVAVSMEIVGILPIAALLVTPAAAARRFSRSPEGMAALASGIGVLSVCAGIAASLRWDTPSGPSVALAAAAFFAASQIVGRRQGEAD